MQQVESFVGQPWVITQAPADDFSIDPDWLRHNERNLQVYNLATKEWQPYRWDKFVERLPQNSE